MMDGSLGLSCQDELLGLDGFVAVGWNRPGLPSMPTLNSEGEADIWSIKLAIR